ncbi:MAG: hypothetical protein K6G57_07790 [Lachnospiraceae bacterium]|nr:hypothetical protein [Lachnospiraceae bacterium]
MHLFGKKKKLKDFITLSKLSVLLFIAVFVYFMYSVRDISDDTISRQETSLNSALKRSIVSCYCVEGTYPPSLDYIKEHYGLTYDESLFFVDYQAIGSNIYPDVTVIRRVKKEH